MSMGRDEDALLGWSAAWLAALQARFPDDWRSLASSAGYGLTELLDSEPDLVEAHHTCVNGLLASSPLRSQHKYSDCSFRNGGTP